MRYALFMLVFCSFQMKAQQVIQWQKCLGGPGYESITAIKPTSDHGFILCGNVHSNGGDVLGVIGGGDFWIIKLDSVGNIKWQKILGGTNNDVPYAICLASDGGYLVAGTTESNNVNVSGNHGMTDYWVVKLNKSGWFEWQKAYGGSSTEECYSVCQAKDGGYVLAGKSGSQDGDVSGNHGYFDYWIVKIDETGNLIWEKSYGGSDGIDIPHCINSSKDGGYVILGETNSKTGDVSGNHGNLDYWAIKIDSVGSLQWQKALGGSGGDTGSWIEETKEDGYIMIGTTGSGNSGNVSGTHGGFDIWVVKLDPLGQLQWQRAYGGPDDDIGTWISETKNGEYVFSASTLSNDGDVNGNHGNFDFWLGRANTQGGGIVSKISLGGYDLETCTSGALTHDEGIALVGYTESNSGNVSGNHGAYDGWIVKLSPTNTPTLTPTLTQLNLYPNPTNQQTTLQIPDNEPITSIQITDLSRKTLKTEQAPQGKTLQVAMLPKGMYLLKATSASGKVFCGKFIKE